MSCFRSLDVKTIIQKWYKELAQDTKDYERQAHKVNIWDRQLRENQKVSSGTLIMLVLFVTLLSLDVRVSC
jgi:hypothetical protein